MAKYIVKATWASALALAIVALFMGQARTGDKKSEEKDDDPISKLDKEGRKKLGEEMRDLLNSPKDRIEMTVVTAETVGLKPDTKDPKVNVAVVEVEVKIKNIGKDDFPYRPKYLDLAVCGADGKELSHKNWTWDKNVHGITGTYPIKPGKTGYRKARLVFAGEEVKPGQTYTIVACYLGLTEGKYATAKLKTAVAKEEKK